eukprot:2541356-Pyramimonas_sp.AAC.1
MSPARFGLTIGRAFLLNGPLPAPSGPTSWGARSPPMMTFRARVWILTILRVEPVSTSFGAWGRRDAAGRWRAGGAADCP